MAYWWNGRPGRQRLQLSDHGDSCARDSRSSPGEEKRACTDPRKPSYLACEFRSGYQADALCLCLRQNFPQSLECRGVRMTNRHGFALFARAAHRQFELLADGRHLSDVVEEGNIAEGGANPEVLRCSVSARI